MLKQVQHDKKIVYVLLFFTFNFSLLTFNLSEANAQQISLGLSPPLLEVFIKPGKSILVAYNFDNYGDPNIFKAKVLPFKPKDNLGHIKILDEFEGPIRFSLDNSFIQLDEPFFLKTRDSQQLLLRIRVPEGAPEGDYYYTLLAESQEPPTTEGISASRAKGTIGSNILITVTDSGKIDLNGKIALFEVVPRWKIGNLKFFDSSDRIPVYLIIDNRGKNMFKPQGEILLKGNFGEKATYDIIPQNILAESQRLIMASPSAQLDCENRTGQACLSRTSLLLSGFFIGKYNLSTTVSFGENSPTIFASTSFVALPFKLILGFLVAVILGIILIYRNRWHE